MDKGETLRDSFSGVSFCEKETDKGAEKRRESSQHQALAMEQ